MTIFSMFATDEQVRENGMNESYGTRTLSGLLKSEIKECHHSFRSFAAVTFQRWKFHLEELIEGLRKIN